MVNTLQYVCDCLFVQPGSYIAPVLSESADQINSESASLAANTYESFGRTIAGGINVTLSYY